MTIGPFLDRLDAGVPAHIEQALGSSILASAISRKDFQVRDL